MGFVATGGGDSVVDVEVDARIALKSTVVPPTRFHRSRLRANCLTSLGTNEVMFCVRRVVDTGFGPETRSGNRPQARRALWGHFLGTCSVLSLKRRGRLFRPIPRNVALPRWTT